MRDCKNVKGEVLYTSRPSTSLRYHATVRVCNGATESPSSDYSNARTHTPTPKDQCKTYTPEVNNHWLLQYETLSKYCIVNKDRCYVLYRSAYTTLLSTGQSQNSSKNAV